jgi:hypothetical protein
MCQVHLRKSARFRHDWTVNTATNANTGWKPGVVQETDDSRGNQPFPRSVTLLGLASLLNDVASEMICPLLPQFLFTVLGGNRFHLGIIEGIAVSVTIFRSSRRVRIDARAGGRRGCISHSND